MVRRSPRRNGNGKNFAAAQRSCVLMEMMEILMDILEVEMVMLVEHKRDLEGLYTET